jgi:hypothetical protein
VTTTRTVSTNGEFQAAITNCASGTTCEIEVTADMAITSTLDMSGKNLIIKTAKSDESNAKLDGQGTTQLVKMMDAGSTVTFSGIDFFNGYAVSITTLEGANTRTRLSLARSVHRSY